MVYVFNDGRRNWRVLRLPSQLHAVGGFFNQKQSDLRTGVSKADQKLEITVTARSRLLLPDPPSVHRTRFRQKWTAPVESKARTSVDSARTFGTQRSYHPLRSSDAH